VSPEDLILSKLLWSRQTRSEVQLADARNLAGTAIDLRYLDDWSERLGVADAWRAIRP
jgi:hypothetical protein